MVNVKDTVLIGLWLPVLGVIISGAIAISVFIVRTAINSPIPDISDINIGAEPSLILLGLTAVVGGLYWIVINATFSDKKIDNAIDNAQEVKESVEEEV
jgi:hypothetical protein